jgi:DNA helicase II / ATP-dependent DNA helicase PcrA
MDNIPTLSERNATFRALLNTLNAAQRQAVEQIEGPVLVLAGPGTGKTHLLAARIGKILLDTDTRPGNILCLTFTDAAVSAMRQRLATMIGSDAFRVPVHTFHAFCNRVIQENREYFGTGELEPATELERIEVVRQLLDKLPPEHPLRVHVKDPYQHEGRMRDLFGMMKKEGWTPGHVQQRVAVFLKEIHENPEFIYKKTSKYGKKGEVKIAQVEAIRDKFELLCAAADLYPTYLRAMQKIGRYEYEDMLLWVLRAFREYPMLLRNYQERYLYVLVDEYQDTNGAQNQLLHLLLDYWDNPNIFIVGDDDQSIYEFQGARLKNLVDFYKTYQQNLLSVVLENNYRSSQHILDVASNLIGNNQLRAVYAFDKPTEKRLLAHRNAPSAAPAVWVYENRIQEDIALMTRLETLLAEGIAASEIAVLYARHQQAARLMALLERKNIPYQTKRPVNVLELPPIQHFRELLRYLSDELTRPFSGEHRLFRLLHAPFFGYEPLELAQMAVDLVKSETTWRATLAWKSRTKLDAWIQAAADMPLPMLVEHLYSDTGLLTWALAQPDKIWWLQVLQTLLDFARSEAMRRQNARHYTGGRALAQLLERLERMDDNRLSLEAQQTIRTGNGIQLLTAHASKGLEFEYVFMLDCTEESWGTGQRGGGGRFTLPDTLTLSGEEDQIEARRRLFYVAMTRAKNHLNLSYSSTGPDGKGLTEARFVAEAGLKAQTPPLPSPTLLEAQALLLAPPPAPVITLPETVRLDLLLEHYQMSITGLNRFLRCPLAFYYQDVLRTPETVSESAQFGQSMHHALQYFFTKIKATGKTLPPVEALLKLFQNDMEQRRGGFSPEHFTQRLAIGKQYLARYYDEQIPYWRRRAVVERRIERTTVEGVPVSGVIDKIEWLDNNQLRLVDYKTGNPDPKKTAAPDEAQPIGGEYWRQMAFYILLLESSGIYAESVGSTMVSWLEPDRKAGFITKEIRFHSEELALVRTLIRDTYARIRAQEFTQGCGKPACIWCRMHQERAVTTLFDKEEEGLDDGG